ncbi:hypothetical protein ANCCAN_07123 [Ancylostoma caninum]|uniref:Uncharacterized protein n=1 Tax=Ancylostoma caninum TaxID=29170 RepID=A0A368GU30_ANCCA|nr:hypothetical protein ANCCAN_07123 [Ancylostoma caninum]
MMASLTAWLTFNFQIIFGIYILVKIVFFIRLYFGEDGESVLVELFYGVGNDDNEKALEKRAAPIYALTITLAFTQATQVKRRGFDVVVDRTCNLLREESVAGRMRAIADLHELRIRPGQNVAEFCVGLESLGRKAYSEGITQDRQLEFAQISLSNLKHWPEHVQLLSLLHKVQSEWAYDKVKELALSIELSKKMYSPTVHNRRDSDHDWKV